MEQRTSQQNRALHKYFRLLAEELNTLGLDARKVLKPTYQIWWTEEMVKRDLWKPIQKIMLDKEHTSDLTTKEVDRVFEQINFAIGEKFGVYIPFPSIEDEGI